MASKPEPQEVTLGQLEDTRQAFSRFLLDYWSDQRKFKHGVVLVAYGPKATDIFTFGVLTVVGSTHRYEYFKRDLLDVPEEKRLELAWEAYDEGKSLDELVEAYFKPLDDFMAAFLDKEKFTYFGRGYKKHCEDHPHEHDEYEPYFKVWLKNEHYDHLTQFGFI